MVAALPPGPVTFLFRTFFKLNSSLSPRHKLGRDPGLRRRTRGSARIREFAILGHTSSITRVSAPLDAAASSCPAKQLDHAPRALVMNEISRKPGHTVTELASARQQQEITGRPSWSARWRCTVEGINTTRTRELHLAINGAISARVRSPRA